MVTQRIKSLRVDAARSVDDLARILHCDCETYQSYEDGAQELTFEVLAELADFYQTSTDYILGLTDQRTPHRRK